MKSNSVGHQLPVRASGEFLGHRWTYHAEILGDSVSEWVTIAGPNDESGGGGGGGALPFADLGWKVLGAIGSTGWSPGGWSRPRFRKKYSPGYVSGVVSSAVASVLVEFERASPATAMLIDSGHPAYQFFFLPLPPQTRWRHSIARDANGVKCDRFALPPDH